MLSHEEIEPQIREIVAEILSLEIEEINSDSRFFADLGGESIDVLDLEFRCEKQFGIKTEFQKIFNSQNLAPSPDGTISRDGTISPERAISPDGTISPEALRSLRDQYPFLPFDNLPDKARLDDLKDLLTIRSIAAFVRERLEGNAKVEMQNSISGAC